MQFILEQQAAASATLAVMGARQDKTEQRLSAIDKRLTAIAKLLQTGMKMLVKTDATLKDLAAAHKDLAAAQKRTEVNLNRLIDSQRRGTNGDKR